MLQRAVFGPEVLGWWCRRYGAGSGALAIAELRPGGALGMPADRYWPENAPRSGQAYTRYVERQLENFGENPDTVPFPTLATGPTSSPT